MYKDLINNNVTIVVSSKGDAILEYTGMLIAEDENNLALENANISYLLVNIQRGLFGDSISTYKTDVKKVLINKKYVISCDK